MTMNDTTTITVIIVAVVGLLMVARFWRMIVSAGILVAVVMICAAIFAGYTPTTSTATTSAQCTTPGGIVTACK